MQTDSIKALIFDFDGLILETERPEFQSWVEIYEEHGCTLSLSNWAKGIGTWHQFDPYEHLEVQYGRPIDRETIRAKRRQRNAELLAAESIMPGVVEYLTDARRQGLKLSVASSSSHSWVDDHLLRLGLFDQFDCIRCREDVANAKPFPDLYQAVLEALAISPAQAIAFEDSPNGILAAKRAGIFCVAVPNQITAQLSIDHANLVLPSLADMPLEDLLVNIRKPRAK